jgi:hypothetical protein
LCPPDDPLRKPLDDIRCPFIDLDHSGTTLPKTGPGPKRFELFWVFGPYCKDFFGPTLKITPLTAPTIPMKVNPSLDHHFLLLGIHSTLCVLRGHGY